MAKHGPKPDLSHQELAKISHIVLQYLEASQSYNTHGLLRIAAPDTALSNLTKDLKKLKDTPANVTAQLEKQTIGKDRLDAHVYVGVLKRAILNSGKLALVSKNKSWDTMRDALENTDFNDPDQVNACLDAFDLAIKTLSESNETQDQNAALVLYTLLHVSTKIADKESENKMTPRNCAIVVGPSIGELLAPPNASDALQMVRLMQIANTLAEHLIASGRYALPFEKKIQYQDMPPEQVARELKKNTAMITQLKKQIEQEYNKKGLEDSVSRYKQMIDELSSENTLFTQLLEANKLTPRSRSDSISESSSSSAASPVASSEREVEESEHRGKDKHRSRRIHLVKDINDPKGKEEERPASAPPHKKSPKR